MTGRQVVLRWAGAIVAPLLALVLAASGSAAARPGVRQIAGVTGVKAVSSGNGFFLALLRDGTVRAWGVNNAGQLGDGNTRASSSPVQVKGLTGVTAISAGGFHSVALLQNGTVVAWGYNGEGQLGDGTFGGFSDVPVKVLHLTAIAAVAAGSFHSLALTGNGTVRAWGENYAGQLGDGSQNQFSDVPVAVKNITTATGVSAGYKHSLAVLRDGRVMAWGSNSDGQLGNGNIEIPESRVPEPVVDLSGATAVSAGDVYSLARLANGTVMGWGNDEVAQLGNGLNPPFYTVPVRASGLSTATAVAATDDVARFGGPQSGAETSYALLSSHAVDDWGATSSQNEVPEPTGVTGVQAISPGLFLLQNGTVLQFTP